MVSTAHASRSSAAVTATGHGLERLDPEAEAAYWLRFLNGRWLVYWHEHVIGDFPAANAAVAVDFLRLKQRELPCR
jgi:hypothetical protein